MVKSIPPYTSHLLPEMHKINNPTSQDVLNTDPFIHMGNNVRTIYKDELGCLGHSQVEDRRGSTIGSLL